MQVLGGPNEQAATDALQDVWTVVVRALAQPGGVPRGGFAAHDHVARDLGVANVGQRDLFHADEALDVRLDDFEEVLAGHAHPQLRHASRKIGGEVRHGLHGAGMVARIVAGDGLKQDRAVGN